MNSRDKRIWGNISRYRCKSIFFKNLVINIAFIALPLFLISSFVYWNSSRIVENEIQTISRNTLIRNRDLIDALFKKANFVSATFSRMPSVVSFMNPSPKTVENQITATDVHLALKPFVLADDYIDSIYIYSERQKAIITLTGVFDMNYFQDKNWIEAYEKSDDILPFRINRVLFNTFLPVLSVIKPLQDQSTKQQIGAVVINISLDKLKSSVVSDGKNEVLSVADEAGRIIFSDNSELLGRQLSGLPISDTLRRSVSQSGQYAYEIDEEGLILMERSRKSDLFYLLSIPLSRYDQQLSSTWKMFLLLLLLSFIISLAASLILAISSYRPIDRLLDFISNPEQAGERHFHTEEIKEIASGIMTTVHANQQLRNELFSKLGLLEKTQIAALQAQINPHFLYNTLDAIRWSAMELSGGDNPVAGMTASLARLLRLSLENHGNAVPLKQEIEHAQLFIRLLNFRYPRRISLRWRIDKKLEQYQVLKLSLQPLIENAFYHGIKPTRGPGEIEISAVLEEEMVIRVRDNGRGMAPEAIQTLDRELNRPIDFRNAHIGLKNVHQRMQLVFGEEYGIRISSRPEGGLSIEMRYPRRKEIYTQKASESDTEAKPFPFS